MILNILIVKHLQIMNYSVNYQNIISKLERYEDITDRLNIWINEIVLKFNYIKIKELLCKKNDVNFENKLFDFDILTDLNNNKICNINYEPTLYGCLFIPFSIAEKYFAENKLYCHKYSLATQAIYFNFYSINFYSRFYYSEKDYFNASSFIKSEIEKIEPLIIRTELLRERYLAGENKIIEKNIEDLIMYSCPYLFNFSVNDFYSGKVVEGALKYEYFQFLLQVQKHINKIRIKKGEDKRIKYIKDGKELYSIVPKYYNYTYNHVDNSIEHKYKSFNPVKDFISRSIIDLGINDNTFSYSEKLLNSYTTVIKHSFYINFGIYPVAKNLEALLQSEIYKSYFSHSSTKKQNINLTEIISIFSNLSKNKKLALKKQISFQSFTKSKIFLLYELKKITSKY